MAHPRTRRGLLATSAGAVLAALLALVPAGPAQADPSPGTVLSEASDPSDLISGSYIVVLKDDLTAAAEVDETAARLTGAVGGQTTRTFHNALRGFTVRVNAAQARRLATDPTVAFVQQNARVRASTTQANPPSWGLDRIDQRNRPLDASYTYTPNGSGVHAYIVDTGIRTTHSDFGGRASVGFDAIGDGRNGQDCNGHGTHVAATTGGAAYGVAKGVTLVAVRVLNCDGSGTIDQVIAGVDWVTANAMKPAVANMSLGGGTNTALDTAVRRSITSGVQYAIAAGNGFAGLFAQNACNTSPARVTEAITVSVTDINDRKPSWGNIGTCVDLFAPGVDITSAWMDSDTATNTISGTSMSTPHVTGAAALYLQGHTAATPAQVRDAIVANATTGVVVSPGSGSPNRLLYTPGL